MRLFLLVVFILSNQFCFSQTKNAKDIATKMLTACDNMKTAKYVLKKQERQKDNTLRESELIVKLQVNPYKTYSYSVNPNPGAEALYISGENSGKVFVNPNQFPYVNLNLDPYGSTLRENQHHTVLDMGFKYISSIVKAYIKNDEAGFFGNLSYDGEIEWNKKSCYKLTFDNKKFSYVTYTVQAGETLTSIAKKMNVSDFMILTANPNIDDYDDVKTGQKIKVPNSYAQKIVFYIDKTNYLPLVQIIYDDKGLFEKYELNSFILNPTFNLEEFTSKYKDYKF